MQDTRRTLIRTLLQHRPSNLHRVEPVKLGGSSPGRREGTRHIATRSAAVLHVESHARILSTRTRQAASGWRQEYRKCRLHKRAGNGEGGQRCMCHHPTFPASTAPRTAVERLPRFEGHHRLPSRHADVASLDGLSCHRYMDIDLFDRYLSDSASWKCEMGSPFSARKQRRQEHE